MSWERKRIWKTAAVMIPLAAVAYLVAMAVPVSHPAELVKSQVVRGERITPLANSNSTNGLASTTVAKVASARPILPTSTLGSGPTEVGFDTLSAFEFIISAKAADIALSSNLHTVVVMSQIPEDIQKLEGKKVTVKGFLMPVRLQHGLVKEFLLLKNQSMCCYAVIPQINEWVIAKVKGEGIQPLMDQTVSVTGTFHVNDFRENGFLTGIYEMDVDNVKNPENEAK